jgi:hypothetical protein
MLTIDDRAVSQPGRRERQFALARALRAVTDPRATEDEDPLTTPDTVPPERWQLANAGILHLSPIVRQLVELWKGPKNDDFGCLQPTQYAFDRTIEFLVDAAIDANSDKGRQIPSGCVSTDSEGGVRIEWIRDAASVHMVVPAQTNRAAYVYHETGNDYATEDMTPRRLSHLLRAIT